MSTVLNRADAARTLTDFSNYATKQTDRNAIIHFAGQDRQFSVDTNDRIRGFFTWSAPGHDTAANNATRDAFKTALLTLFNKQSLNDLPESVRDVLKKGNFDGSGKPLTAHRINDIMTEVAKTQDYKDAVVEMKNAEKAKFETQILNAAATNPDQINMLPGKDQEAKIAVFKGFCKTAKKHGLSPFQTLSTILPALCFKPQQDKLAQAKHNLMKFITSKMANAKQTNEINPKTSVNARALRETHAAPITINGKTINGKNADNDATIQEILDENVEIEGVESNELTESVWQSQNTTVSGATGKSAMAIHKALCKAIPGKEMRELVSTILSVSEGIKGFFDNQVMINGTDKDQLNLYGDGRVGTTFLEEHGIVAVPIQDIGTFNISTDEQGNVKVDVKVSVGMRSTEAAKEDQTIYCKTDFNVVIDLKNELDDQGHPTIANIDIQAE